jgi:hypothetical protein
VLVSRNRWVTPSANPPYGTDISAMRKLPVVPTCRTPARLPVAPDTLHLRRHPAPVKEGRIAIVTDVRARGSDGREASATDDALSLRTAKPCGPDAATLVSSAWEASFSGMTVATNPVHRGEHGISRKTIAQGMPDPFGEPVVTILACFSLSHARLRVHRAPGIPCALRFPSRARKANLVRTGSGIANPCPEAGPAGLRAV